MARTLSLMLTSVAALLCTSATAPRGGSAGGTPAATPSLAGDIQPTFNASCNSSELSGTRSERPAQPDGPITARRALLCQLAPVFAAGAMPAPTRQYQVDMDRPRRVVFHSKARLDSFQGVADRIDGYVAWGNGALIPGGDYQGSELYFAVELNALDTGLRLRNQYMRDNYLETAHFPYATYKGAIQSVTAGRGDTLLVAVSGRFTVHGVDRPLDATCPVVREGPAGYRVRCQFHMRLADHGIRIPSLAATMLSEVLGLTVDFSVARAES